MCFMYESKIRDARWIAYDLPEMPVGLPFWQG